MPSLKTDFGAIRICLKNEKNYDRILTLQQKEKINDKRFN